METQGAETSGLPGQLVPATSCVCEKLQEWTMPDQSVVDQAKVSSGEATPPLRVTRVLCELVPP